MDYFSKKEKLNGEKPSLNYNLIRCQILGWFFFFFLFLTESLTGLTKLFIVKTVGTKDSSKDGETEGCAEGKHGKHLV